MTLTGYTRAASKSILVFLSGLESMLIDSGLYCFPILAFWHYKQAVAAAFNRPEFTQPSFFLGIVIAPSIRSLVFHHQKPAVL